MTTHVNISSPVDAFGMFAPSFDPQHGSTTEESAVIVERLASGRLAPGSIVKIDPSEPDYARIVREIPGMGASVPHAGNQTFHVYEIIPIWTGPDGESALKLAEDVGLIFLGVDLVLRDDTNNWLMIPQPAADREEFEKFLADDPGAMPIEENQRAVLEAIDQHAAEQLAEEEADEEEI